VANDGTGDPLRTALGKVNANFTELYNLNPYSEQFYSQDIVVSGIVQDFNIIPVEADKYFIVTSVTFVGLSITGSQTGAPATNKYVYFKQNGSVIMNSIAVLLGKAVKSISYFAGINDSSIIDLTTYPLVLECDVLPSGVTANTIKVIIKGFKIAK
jgi:hypothetical protein